MLSGQRGSLKEQLREGEMDAAVEAEVHAITMEEKRLGPVPTADVYVNGVATKALLDTGSPSTIASLRFVLSVMKQDRGLEPVPVI